MPPLPLNLIHHNLLSYLLNQNASFLSQLHPSSIPYNLCKWAALLIALLLTFRSILIVRFRQNATPHPSISLLIADDHYSDTDDDADETSSSSDFEDEDDQQEQEQEEEETRTAEYFRVRGSGDGDGGGAGFLRCRSIGDILSLSEIANSKSVVKLWDTIGFGLGFGLDHSASSSDGSVVSFYGVNEEQKVRPVPTGKPPTSVISSASPAVVVYAGENASGNLALRIWDTRIRRRIPAVIAEWEPSLGIESGGVQKVYVRDDGRCGLTVGDMRNVTTPLENVAESQLDLWWPNSFMFKI